MSRIIYRDMETKENCFITPVSKKIRLKNQIKSIFTKPYNIMCFLIILALSYLILVPLAQIIIKSFTLAKVDVKAIKGSHTGMFTLYYWGKIFCSQIAANVFFKPLAHSLVVGFFTSLFAIIIGGSFAWLMVRSDLPHKKFFSLMLLVPYMLPSWALALSWNVIFRNTHVGGNPGFLNYFGIMIPDWLAYGPIPIIVVLTLHYYAYTYLLVSASLKSVNSEIEEMGEIIGASKIQIIRKITFPLVLPSILSALILTFSKAIGTFGVPSMLGMKVGYNTISTMVRSTINSTQANLGYTISLMLVTISAIFILVNQVIIGKRKSYVTMTGKGSRANPIPLGKAKTPILIVMYLFVILCIIMPVVLMIYQTLMMKIGDYSFSNLTLHYWIGKGRPDIYESLDGVLRNERIGLCLWNTVKLVIFTSIFATLIGQMIGYVNARGRKLKSGKIVEQLAFIPYLIPSISFGAMYLTMFSKPTKILGITVIPSLYGTFILLVLVSAVKHIPFASRSGTSSMLQISEDLEESGQLAGASFFTRIRRIVLPLAKHGFMSGFMLVFISIMKELDLIVLLMRPDQYTLSYLAYWYSVESWTQPSNCIAIIMFVLVFIANWISNKYFNADMASGLGG